MKITYLERAPGTWRLRIETAGPTGARAFAYETVHGDEEAARRRRFELLQEHEQGTWAKPEKILFSAYLDRWTEQRLALGVIGRSTYEVQASILRVYVKPALGGKRLQAITSSDIQRLYVDLLTTPTRNRERLSNSFVRLIHRTLGTVLKDARKTRLIRVNPMEEVTPPERVRARAGKAITVEAALRLADDLRGHWLEPVVMLALGTGLRRGEACGLRWRDMDLDARKLYVRGQIVGYLDGTLEWKEPKSAAGVRTIGLPPELVDMLRARRREAAEHRMAAGLGGGLEDAYVFTRDGIEPVRPDTVTRAFREFCDAHGLPQFTFHGTRHTHATHMLKAVGRGGAKAVSQRLGHASIDITLDVYQTVFESDDNELADLASGLLKGRENAKRT